MEGGSKSQLPCEDSHISPEFFVRLAVVIKGLIKHVGDILEEMKEDVNFSEMTEEIYDEKKSNLTRHLTELSRMHKVLADQIDLGNEKEKVIKLQEKVVELNCAISDSNLKNTKMGDELEASKNKCRSLQMEKDQQSSHHEDANFLVSLAEYVKVLQELVEKILDEVERDGNFSEITAERYDKKKSYLTIRLTVLSRTYKELADELSTSLKYSPPIGLNSDNLGNEKAKVIELQKEVVDRKRAIYDSNLEGKKIGDELKASEKKVKLADKVIKGLKQQRSLHISKESQLGQEIQSVVPLISNAKHQAYFYEKKIESLKAQVSLYEAELAERDNQITELKRKSKQTALTQMKRKYEMEENNWKNKFEKLSKELEKKRESLDDLKKTYASIQAENCYMENLIQEKETRLLAESENAQKVINQLTERVLELEKEVERKNEVISIKKEQNKEFIRRVSSAIEHYKSLG